MAAGAQSALAFVRMASAQRRPAAAAAPRPLRRATSRSAASCNTTGSVSPLTAVVARSPTPDASRTPTNPSATAAELPTSLSDTYVSARRSRATA